MVKTESERMSYELRRAKKIEALIVDAFVKTLGIGSKVTHAADAHVGIIVGRAPHTYEWLVLFGKEKEPSMCYARNLRPEWWPHREIWSA